MQTSHFFQYDDGVENIEGEDGNVIASSANIKLFAESLMEERWVTLESTEANAKLPGSDGPEEAPWRNCYTTVETDQATGVNTEQIYEGIRHSNEELKPYQILAARLRMPEVKIAALIEKGGEGEWRRALEAGK